MTYCKHCDHCNADRLDGLNMRKRRKDIGLSLRELAGRLGISVVYLSDIERNLRHAGMSGIGGRILDELDYLERDE